MSDALENPHPGQSVVAVVGGGPAGLMAAEVVGGAGHAVILHERMPTAGRKLLIAGRGGLNLTHSEPFETLAGRYGPAADRLRPILEDFPPAALIRWAEGLGQPTFIGSSGRVFPTALKASPLLRAWLRRLAGQGVDIRTRSEWLGWDADGALRFRGTDGAMATLRPDATILALGGASWPKLGSTGAWADLLAGRGVPVAPFRPANCGLEMGWSDVFRDRFAGEPLKGIALTHGGTTVRGEAVIAGYGLEGGAVYALSAQLRDALGSGEAVCLEVDLRPDQTPAQLAAKLAQPRGSQSLSNFLRRALNLSPVAINLLREGHGTALPSGPMALAAAIKRVPLRPTGVQPIARAISSAGGIRLEGVDERLAIRSLTAVWAAGEMLDWEAPTGGYLLQACFATGAAAGRSVVNHLHAKGGAGA